VELRASTSTLLRVSIPHKAERRACNLRGVHGPVAAVAILTLPTLGAIIFTRQPTDCFAIVYPGRALFPGGDGETHCPKVRSNHPSKLACTPLLRVG